MPSRRLRVARRFWSSSRAFSCARSAGGTVPPGSMPSERSALSRSSASFSSVIAFASAVATSISSAAAMHRAGHAPDAEGEFQRASPPIARLLVRREAVRHADVRLRLAGGAGRLRQADAVAPRDQLGDLVDVRNAQPDGAHPRPDGRDEVGLARSAEDPDRARRRLLEGLEQHVRGALRHAVGVLDDHDAVAPDRRASTGWTPPAAAPPRS